MFTQLLERIALGLEERQIPYMIIGGQAVLIYGEPRLTRDKGSEFDLGYIRHWLREFDRSLDGRYLEAFDNLKQSPS